MSATADAEEVDGEGYFASVSDLMSGVLFVFLLMLTVFALNFRDAEDEQQVQRDLYEQALKEAQVAKEEARREAENARIQQEIARREAENAQMQQENARREAENARRKEAENLTLRDLLEDAVDHLEREIESRQVLRMQMLQRLKDDLLERGVKVTLDTRSGILRLAGDVLFETGQAEYREEASATVRTLADVLAQVLPCYANGLKTVSCGAESAPILETVLIEGHTDRQPYRGLSPEGSQRRNDELSTQRALAVFHTLRQTQPKLEALRSSEDLPLLGFSGYGERRPLLEARGDTAEEFQRNRRIDVRFVLSSRTSDDLERLRDQIRGLLQASR